MESEFFSGRTPVLINEEFETRVSNMLNVEEYEGPSLNRSFKWLYNEYIVPNMFALIFISCIGIFLYIKWHLAKEKRKKKKKKKNKNKKGTDDSRRVMMTENGVAYVYDDQYGKYVPMPTSDPRVLTDDKNEDDYSMTKEDLETEESDHIHQRHASIVRRKNIPGFDDRLGMDRIAQRTFGGSYVDRGGSPRDDRDFSPYNN